MLDWLEGHTAGWTRPAPASDHCLHELAMEGAPIALLDLYRTVGADAPGLLPHPLTDVGAPLIDASRSMQVRADLVELGFRSDGSFWAFGGPPDADYAWLINFRGVYALTDYHNLELRGSLDDVLRAHFQRLAQAEYT